MSNRIPNSLPLIASLLLAAGVAAQSHVCGAAVLSANGQVRLVDPDGAEIGRIATQGWPSVYDSEFGPRLLVTDAAGFRLHGRDGSPIGAMVPRIAGFQSVTTHGTRVAVVDDDRVRLLDLYGNVLSTVMRQGSTRPSVFLTDHNMVISEPAFIRFYDLSGQALGANQPNGPARPIVRGTKNGSVKIEGNKVTFYDRDGHPIGPVLTTTGAATVITDGDRVIVIDDTGTSIYEDNGQHRTTVGKTGQRRQQVKVAGDRIIVIDDDQVRVFDRMGRFVGAPVTTQGRADVAVTDDRIVVTDDRGTRIFEKDTMRQVVEVGKTGTDRQIVVASDDRIVIIDQDRVRTYDDGGRQQGPAVPRTGGETQRVLLGGNRVIVIDDNRVRVLDAQGNVLQDIPVSNLIPSGVQLFERALTITEDGSLRIFDLDGIQQGGTMAVGFGIQHVAALGADRLVVTDGNRSKVFGVDGRQVGLTHTMPGDPEVSILCWTAGGVRQFGQGCGGVTHAAFGSPVPGGGMALQVAGAPGNALTLLALGASDESWGSLPLPLDLGALRAPGCYLLASPDLVVAVAVGSNGMGGTELTIPDKAGIVGAALHSQMLVHAPAANAFGWLTSNGITTTIGSGE